MKYIIEEELYNKISKIMCHYDTLLERLGEDCRGDTLERDFNDFSEIWAEYDDLPTYEDENTTGERREPAVGDRVRVINSGESYTTYSGWIEKYISEPVGRYLWDYGKACNDGDEGEILFIAPHEYGSMATLAYVKMDNERCYLIGTKGLEVI